MRESVGPRDDDLMERCAGKCNRVLPLNESCFHRDATSPTGFMSICKVCRSEQRRVKEAKSVLAAVERLEEKGLALLEETIEEASRAGLAHSAQSLEEIQSLFGGSRGFAKHVFGHYLAMEAGSAGRTKMLIHLMQMQLKLSEMGYAEQNVEEMTDEQLIDEMEKALRKHRKTVIQNVD